MKISFFFSFLTLIFFSSCLQAVSGIVSIEDLEKQIKELTARLDAITQPTEEECERALTLTSARPDVCGEWFVMVDILYWQPRIGGTAFVYSNWMRSIDLPIKGRTRKIDFQWDWGGRIGLGRNFCHDQWDATLTYTGFGGHGSKSASAGLNSTLIPLKGTIVTDHEVSYAKSSFNYDFDNLDLELGRHFYTSGKCSLRPFVSLRTTWVDLDQETRYWGGFLGVQTAKIKDEVDFWGMGPRFGLNTEWNFQCGFKLIGNLSGSLLFSYYDVKLKEHLTSTLSRIELSDNEHRLTPNVDLFIGGGYGTYLNENRQFLNIAIGYESQYWWRQNQILRVYEYDANRYESISEDVGLQGLTIKLRLDF